MVVFEDSNIEQVVTTSGHELYEHHWRIRLPLLPSWRRGRPVICARTEHRRRDRGAVARPGEYLPTMPAPAQEDYNGPRS